jgi:hypothetical protein
LIFNRVQVGKVDRIQKELPEVLVRLQEQATVPVEKQMNEFAATGFPNY